MSGGAARPAERDTSDRMRAFSYKPNPESPDNRADLFPKAWNENELRDLLALSPKEVLKAKVEFLQQAAEEEDGRCASLTAKGERLVAIHALVFAGVVSATFWGGILGADYTAASGKLLLASLVVGIGSTLGGLVFGYRAILLRQGGLPDPELAMGAHATEAGWHAAHAAELLDAYKTNFLDNQRLVREIRICRWWLAAVAGSAVVGLAAYSVNRLLLPPAMYDGASQMVMAAGASVVAIVAVLLVRCIRGPKEA